MLHLSFTDYMYIKLSHTTQNFVEQIYMIHRLTVKKHNMVIMERDWKKDVEQISLQINLMNFYFWLKGL